MRRPFALLAALVALALPPLPAAAQFPRVRVDSAPPAAALLCSNPKPMQWCRAFLVTELGVAALANAGAEAADAHVLWELGCMHNRSRNTALGGTAMVALSDDFARVALKLRYRRWLARAIPLDLSPGIIFLGSNTDHNPEPMLGFTGHAGLSLGDVAGGFVQLEIADYPGTGVAPRIYIGGRLGSRPGLVASVLAPILFTLARDFVVE